MSGETRSLDAAGVDREQQLKQLSEKRAQAERSSAATREKQPVLLRSEEFWLELRARERARVDEARARLPSLLEEVKHFSVGQDDVLENDASSIQSLAAEVSIRKRTLHGGRHKVRGDFLAVPGFLPAAGKEGSRKSGGTGAIASPATSRTSWDAPSRVHPEQIQLQAVFHQEEMLGFLTECSRRVPSAAGKEATQARDVLRRFEEAAQDAYATRCVVNPTAAQDPLEKRERRTPGQEPLSLARRHPEFLAAPDPAPATPLNPPILAGEKKMLDLKAHHMLRVPHWEDALSPTRANQEPLGHTLDLTGGTNRWRLAPPPPANFAQRFAALQWWVSATEEMMRAVNRLQASSEWADTPDLGGRMQRVGIKEVTSLVLASTSFSIAGFYPQP
ncbi:hypothetical protein T484DRAFT_1834354 [Baffinella frigidus]|nr:hypothetical protein T484DRAFT_1834354 [Cryptophyta sp. CCMP2293]